jgi:diguanylate cyclase (GGDEF)-like protein
MEVAHNSWLVALSIAVAIVVSYTALGLGARVAAAKGTAGRVWLVLGALSMGIGVWSMHFIGMLALAMPIKLTYSVPTTLASLGVAIFTSGFALRIASAPRLDAARHFICSIVMGAGIAAMHYTGMAAIMIAPGLQYAILPVAASLLIAVVASWLALWLTFVLRSNELRHVRAARLGAAVLMGCAIAGMHYTAMQAVLIAPGAICVGGMALDQSWFASCIAVVTLGILGITILSSLFDAHMASRARIYAASIERADKALLHQATHDSLTGLPNRGVFLDSLRQAVERVRRGEQAALGVLFLDLDRFKFVNDTQGHEAGDELLRQVAARLTSAIRVQQADDGRPGDVVSRFGGDEFLILLNRLPGAGDAKLIAERLQRLLASTYQIHGREVHCSASIGLVTDRLGGVSADDIVRNADVAMYEAKRGGRAGTIQFSSTMHERISRQVMIESSLRHAIGSDDLQVVYQPILSLATGRLASVEALVRWEHPILGAVPPSEFIPIAEDSGLIVQLDRWVREQACSAMRHWLSVDPQRAPETVSVNVSRVELAQAGEFRVRIADLLRAMELPAARLQLEVTERNVMRNPQAALKLMRDLKALGVKIAMDDFGTDASSLSVLRTYPFDVVKIDRSFLEGLLNVESVQAVMHATIGLIERLGMASVVEGIEEPAQRTLLRAMGCGYGQGWLFSRPVPADKVLELAERLQQAAEEQGSSARSGIRPHMRLVGS